MLSSHQSHGSGTSRRTLYRHTKRMLLRLLSRRWKGPRTGLEPAVRRFLRTRPRGELLRLPTRRALGAGILAGMTILAAFAVVPLLGALQKESEPQLGLENVAPVLSQTSTTGGLAGCPVSRCEDDDCRLTQSLDTVTDGGNVACGIPGVGTTENGWARCYNLAWEGVPAGDFNIAKVTFGVEQATIDGINVDVVLYLDGDGCPPTAPGADAIELDRASVVVNRADEGTFISVSFPGVPTVPSGTDLVVEIENLDDGTVPPEFSFRTMSNANGQCGPSYIRAAQCGIPGWADLGALGWPDFHLIQVIEGTVKEDCPADCGDGDGNVGIVDLLALLAQWGGPGACDFDGSGAVGISDLLKLLANWGPCP